MRSCDSKDAEALPSGRRWTWLAALVACLSVLPAAACTGVVSGAGASAGGGSGSGGAPGASGSGAATGTGTGSVSGVGGGPSGTGNAPGAGSGGTPAAGTGGATPAAPAMFGTCPSDGGEPGPTPIMKLSTIQYRNTVRDLLAASGVAAVTDDLGTMLAAVPEDSTVTLRGLDQRVSSDHLQAYFDVAVAAGDGATSSSTRLTALAGSCASTSPLSSSCLDAFLTSFGRRAFRRPLTTDEQTAFRDVAMGTSPSAASAADAIRNVVVTMMMSPPFVNHLELDGTPISGRSDYLQLSPYEIASRLSYTFRQTMPDDALLAAADDGSLGTDAGFAAALESRVRGLADARHHLAVLERVDALRFVHRVRLRAPRVPGAGGG